jgi:hypothetical protein
MQYFNEVNLQLQAKLIANGLANKTFSYFVETLFDDFYV